MNKTTTCRCGGEKSERVQFCTPCWEALPTKERALFVHSFGALQAAIRACENSLDIDKVNVEEQPCL